MSQTVLVKLDPADISKIIDALQLRRTIWERTAIYLESELVPEEGVVECCDDANEAWLVEQNYSRIIQSIASQIVQ